MKTASTLSLLGLAGQALAFPRGAVEYAAKEGMFSKRQLAPPNFDAAKQKIDVSGAHAFVQPSTSDERGPCPGLNALANHNYIPHSGVATIQQFIDGTTSVFGMGADLATFLAVYGAVMDGNLVSWSIGDASPLVPGLLSTPQGISFSHNKYETDGSPTRGDLYKYGDAAKLVMSQWEQMYALQAGKSNEESNYDLSVLTPFRAARVADSVATNPYFFNAPFSGIAVQPAAYTFIYRFMGNKSAEHPEGVLNKEVLKSFFAITGEEGSFQHNWGSERIPENWYRRAFGDEYTIPFYVTDVLAAAREYPQFIAVGGNTGTTNSFTGVNLGDLGGGLSNLGNLLEGDNLGCFIFQGALQFAPDLLQGLVSDVSGALNTLSSVSNGALQSFSCPALSNSKVDTSKLQQFPGYSKLNKKTGKY